jgi:predicted transcriptional regulator
MDWAKYGHVIASQYRKKIVLCLVESPRTPKQISEETNLYLSHVSHTINDLQKMGIVTCLTPKLKRGKIFALTKIGKEIAHNLEKLR